MVITFLKEGGFLLNHYVDREIKSKELSSNLITRTPRVLFDQKSIELCNLHTFKTFIKIFAKKLFIKYLNFFLK